MVYFAYVMIVLLFLILGKKKLCDIRTIHFSINNLLLLIAIYNKSTKQIKILTDTSESENSVIAPGKHPKIE